MADLLARDQIEQVVKSEGWAHIRRRVQEMRERKVNTLLRADSWEKALQCQAFVEAIDTVLNVPEILKAEFSAKIR